MYLQALPSIRFVLMRLTSGSVAMWVHIYAGLAVFANHALYSHKNDQN
jgi:hypothetical protein